MAKNGTGRRAVLRGSALATVDEAGRLKLPAGFRRTIESRWGRALYLTSLAGDGLWVYPLPVWQEKERRILALPSPHPAVRKFLARTSYYGSETEMDRQGRVVVPGLVRAAASIDGEVAVLGTLNHLEVWRNDDFRARLERDPLSPEDLAALSGLGL